MEIVCVISLIVSFVRLDYSLLDVAGSPGGPRGVIQWTKDWMIVIIRPNFLYNFVLFHHK